MRWATLLLPLGLLAGCAGGERAVDAPALGPTSLAEACRRDEALAAIAAELATADPASIRYRVALHDRAVLLRDGEADAAAAQVEAILARLDDRDVNAVREEILRDVAVLRQRRALTFGRAGC